MNPAFSHDYPLKCTLIFDVERFSSSNFLNECPNFSIVVAPFTIAMDYNKFRELFHRSEEEKEMKNSEKAKRTRLEKKKQKINKDAKR